MMNEHTLLWMLGGLQTVNLLLLGWIKVDIKDLWKRVNSHGHSIECAANDCKPKTAAVTIHEA